jgi:hypothetical protein
MERTITSKYVGLITTRGIAIIDSKNYPKLNGHKVYSEDDTKGYIRPRISMNGKSFALSNFILNHNPGDSNGKLTVDHKNRDPFDNREENLRIVNQETQSINRYGSIIKGVRFKKAKGKGKGFWIATWSENNKVHTKYFSVNKYGYETAWEKAYEYRLLIEVFIPKYFDKLCLKDNSESFILNDVNNNPDITIIDQTRKLDPTKNITYYPAKNRRRRAYYVAFFYNSKKHKYESKTFSVWDTDEKAKKEAIKWRKKKIKKHSK